MEGTQLTEMLVFEKMISDLTITCVLNYKLCKYKYSLSMKNRNPPERTEQPFLE